MVWLAAFLWALHACFTKPSRKLPSCVLVSFSLIGITHLGVLGGAILIGVIIGALQLWQERRGDWRKLAMGFSALDGFFFIALSVLYQFDPERVSRLLGPLGNPLSFAQGKGEPLPGMTAKGFSGFRYATFILLFGAMALPALILIWRWRSTLPAPTFAVAAGCAPAVLALVGLWVTSGDRLLRFMILAYISATLTLFFFAIRHLTRPLVQMSCAIVAAGFWIGLMPGSMAVYGRAAIPDAAGPELHGLKPLITNPRKTLIATGHGLEWWAAWKLKTNICQGTALEIADWEKYEEVLFLKQNADLLPMTEIAMNGGGGMPESVDCPPDGTIIGSYFASPPIPEDAEMLHVGKFFTLARISHPPSYLK
ncbi:MAG: hypothetical protein ACKVHP_11985 [Verrucomicrobiales bacterium]